MSVLGSSNCILLCPVWLLLVRGLLCSEEEMEVVQITGAGMSGELGRGEGGEDVFGMYSMREEPIFNKNY